MILPPDEQDFIEDVIGGQAVCRCEAIDGVDRKTTGGVA